MAGRGIQNLRGETYLQARRNDESESKSRSERDRWTLYEAIKVDPVTLLRAESFLLCVVWCRRSELNRHVPEEHGILSPPHAFLPHPLTLVNL